MDPAPRLLDDPAFALALGAARMLAWQWDVGGTNAVVLAGDPAAVFGPFDGSGPPSFEALMGRIHPDDRPGVEARIQEALDARGAYHADFRTVHPDGSVHTVVGDGQVIVTEGGALRLVGSARNVDAERLAAASARGADDARARLDAFFGTAPVGMALLDAELRYLRINETLAAAHGTTPSGHLGRVPLEVMPAAVGAVVDASARRAIATGLPVEDVPLLGGSPEVPEHWAADFFPAVTTSGERVGVGMVARNVTDRVLAERERAASARRTTTLAAVSRLLETSLDRDETLRRVAEIAVGQFAAWCSIDLAEGGRLRPSVVLHRDPATAPPRPPDALADAAFSSGAPQLAEAERPGTGSVVAVPLTARGRRLGVLVLAAEAEQRFDDDDLQLVVEIGRLAALAVDTAHLFRSATEEQRRSDAARALLDSYLERAPVGFALLDEELRFVRVNAALAALDGIPPAEHVGRGAGELLGTVAAETRAILLRILETGEPVHEVELHTALPAEPERDRQFLCSAYRVELPESGLPGLGVTVVEVSERVRVEQALTAQRDLYETLLRAQSEMGEAFALLEDGRAIYVNEAAEQMTGRTARELCDLPSLAVLVPTDRHRELARHVARAGAGRATAGFETELLTAGGARLTIEASAQPLEADGRGRLVVVVRDVTERKRQEVERERLLAAERRARRETEVAHGRARELAELSEVLDRSMDLRRTLPEAARVLLRGGADVVGIDLLPRGSTTLECLASTSRTPERDVVRRGFVGRSYPLGADNPWAAVARTREPLLTGALPEAFVWAGTDGDPASAVPRSLAVLPLVARGRTVGVVGLGWDAEGHVPAGEELRHLDEIARRLATGIDNAQLYAERSHIASTLQAGLLPPELPAIPGVQAAARYLPAGEASEVGGDFYDLYPTREATWSVVVGDVCGKGAEAAAVTAMARYTLRAATMAEPSGPGRALGLLNGAMVGEQSAERFLTAVLGELRLRPGGADLALACAGHPAPLVVRAGGAVEAVDASGALLGVAGGLTWEDATVALAPGDAVVLYTDGVTEADRRRPLTPAELAELLREAHPAPSAEALADAVRGLAEERAGGPLRDDVAILTLRLEA